MAKHRTITNRDRLEELIEEATVDCYDQDERFMGFHATLEDKIKCPFEARVLGQVVEVIAIQEAERGLGLDAICRIKGKKHRICLASLEWEEPLPEWYEWVEAYFEWCG